MKYIVGEDVFSSRPLEGPLSAHLGGFTKWARDAGYALYSRRRQALLAGCFSRWLGQQRVRLGCITHEHVLRFLRFRARHVEICRGDAAALKHLIGFLRGHGVIPKEQILPYKPSPVEQAVQAFYRYLLNERSLALTTALSYAAFIRGFLISRFGRGTVKLSQLSAGDVVRFVQHQARRLHVKRAKLLTTALRSFLHYLLYRGEIVHDLAQVVPAVANWSMTSIPRAISPDLVRKLLASIDRRSAIGLRDYAILLLLARLGLRASEVAGIELEDIDWNSGSISIHRKGGERSVLPLPAEVGTAIVAYLRHGRPQGKHCRSVFLRSRAPVRGFVGPVAITSVVRHNLARAGITAPTKGAHQFRHGLATDMLRHGASLSEIGELLGHRSPETTHIYTKVDLKALRPLALPWPGGVR
jgi:integrase/recombinase XerD